MPWLASWMAKDLSDGFELQERNWDLDTVPKCNPFAEVLEEIKKRLALIVEEGKQDKEYLD